MALENNSAADTNTKSSMDKLLEQYAPLLKNLIRFSSAVNAKDIKFYKSIDPSIRDAADDIASTLTDTMNRIMDSVSTATTDELNIIKFKPDADNENQQLLSNVLDSLLEKVEINLDNHYKVKKNQQLGSAVSENEITDPSIDDGYTYLDKADAAGNGEASTAFTALPKLNPSLGKPQDKFTDAVDNFETTPFKPLIKFKPNAMQPLEESLQLIEATDEVPEHYPNPYHEEIMNAEYPSWILEPVPEEQQYKSIPWEGSPAAQWIDDPSQLDDLLVELNKCKVIAIDLEHHDYRTYHGLTSLMQITTDTKKDYLIDPLSPLLRPHLPMLNEAFTNPQIVKVFHGAFMDVIWLQRDLGLYLVSLFDTFHASKQLALGKYSLAYLLETYVKFRTSKKWQLADWRIRPLSDEMRDYAKADTHFLIEVFYKMHSELLKIPNALQKALYASRKVATRRFEYATYRPKNLSMSSNSEVVTTSQSVPLIDSITGKLTMSFDRDLPWTNLIFSNNIPLENRPLLEILFKWRDHQARLADESPRFTMSDFILVSLVREFTIGHEDDVTMDSVLAVINKSSKFGGSYYVRKNIKELTEVIKDALVDLKGIDLNKIISESNNNDTRVGESIAPVTLGSGGIADEQSVYESVKDVTKLEKQFNNFYEFYNKIIHTSSNIETAAPPSASETFAIEYDNDGSVNVIKNQSINERITEVVDYFEADMEQAVEIELDDEDLAESEHEDDNAANAGDEPSVKERDEIITLRKKVGAKTKKRKAEELTDISVDFNKSIMQKEEERRGRRGKRANNADKEKKKPSFDPYSRDLLEDMNIPQLKKKKMVDRGKNLVFKKK